MPREIAPTVCLDLPYLNKAPLLHVKREKTVKRNLTREEIWNSLEDDEKEVLCWIRDEIGRPVFEIHEVASE